MCAGGGVGVVWDLVNPLVICLLGESFRALCSVFAKIRMPALPIDSETTLGWGDKSAAHDENRAFLLVLHLHS
jgi:hypothetical protein